MVAKVGSATDVIGTLKQIDDMVVPQGILAAKIIARIGPDSDFRTFAKLPENTREVLNLTGPEFAGNYDVKRRKVASNTGTDLTKVVEDALRKSKDPNLKRFITIFEARTKADRAFFDAETKLLNGEKLPKVAKALAAAVSALEKLKGIGGRAEAEDIAERVGVIQGLSEAQTDASNKIKEALGKKIPAKLAELKAYSEAVKPGKADTISQQIVGIA